MDKAAAIKVKKYVTFEVQGEHYCLKINSVREVLEDTEFTDVPNSPSFVMGVINLRGVILTVIDGSKYITGIPIKVSDSSRILVFEDDDSGHQVGILVDSVSEVIVISEDDVNPFLKKDGGKKYVRGLYHRKDDVCVVLNEGKLFEDSGI
ncbi:chemotaxis protein CheW [Alteromonas macleodii]|uniref:chemotaxis protein CheW n=1 Tax=Alteromonas macleodii TaxID=28108 RepID=UPI0031402116|tara:strand:+ start:149413 stop:149862 length:450 start_codon:yes stop_codon:yes gene_type:complete